MHRRVAILGVVAVLALPLAGCGSSSAGGSSSGNTGGNSSGQTSNSSASQGSGGTSGETITVEYTSNPLPQKLLDQFTKKTGIKVHYVQVGWDALQTKITAAATANTYFADVTDVDWSRIGEYYKTKWFLPLNQYFDLKTLASDVPQLSSFESHGQLLGMPADASIMLTTVNTADFKKAGITKMPTTFAEYNADLKKLQSSGVSPHPLGIPFAAAEGLSTYWYETTAAMGGQVLSPTYQPLFTKPSSAGYKAMQWMVNAYKSGLVPKGNINMTDSEEMQNEMANNQVATILSDYSGNVGTIYNVSKSSKVVNQVQYIETPGVNGVHPDLGNPDGMGIPKTAKYPKAAAQFIKWFTSSQVQADMSGVNGASLSVSGAALPMRLTAIKQLATKNDKESQASEMYQLFKNNAKSTFTNGAPPWYGQFSNAVYTNIHSAAQGQETVAQAIQKIAQTVNKLNQQ